MLTKICNIGISLIMSKSTLHAIRVTKGLSQADCAGRLGVNQATISKWEKGRVPAERVLALCALLDVAPHELRPDLYPAGSGDRA
jgi:transcriptional regulator with XRE-family HTH domain